MKQPSSEYVLVGYLSQKFLSQLLPCSIGLDCPEDRNRICHVKREMVSAAEGYVIQRETEFDLLHKAQGQHHHDNRDNHDDSWRRSGVQRVDTGGGQAGLAAVWGVSGLQRECFSGVQHIQLFWCLVQVLLSSAGWM